MKLLTLQWKIRTTLFVLSIFFFNTNFLFSQAPGLCWQKNYGTSGSESNSLIAKIPGGGMIIGFTVGAVSDFDLQTTLPGPLGGTDVVIMELDNCGNIIWSRRYGTSNTDNLYSLIRMGDGSIVLGCETYSGSAAKMLTYKLDSSGNIIWSKITGSASSHQQYGGYADVASNGDVFITCIAGLLAGEWPGFIGPTMFGNNVAVVRLSGVDGTEVWKKKYGNGDARGYYVESTLDNGGVFCSFARANGGDVTGHIGASDIWVGKFDSLSNLEWQRCLGGTNTEYNEAAVLQLLDSTYIVIGTTMSNDSLAIGNHGGADILLVKLDKNGNLLWNKVYGGSGDDVHGSRGGNPIIQTADGNIVFVGTTSSVDGDISMSNGGNEYWMVKVNASNGAIIWERTVGTSANEKAHSIIEIDPDNFAISGQSNGNNSFDFDQANNGGDDSWIVRLSDKCLGPLYQNISNESTPETCNLNNGTAKINVPNRLLPNDYRWISPTGITSVDSFIINLDSGTYAMEVTDFIGCIDTFTVTVAGMVDNVDPVVNCLTNQSVTVNSSCLVTVPDYTTLVTVTDNCGDSNVVVTQTPSAGTTIGIGNTTIWIFAEDASGNKDSCSFTLNVQDTILPVITDCPSNITISNTTLVCDAVATWTSPVVTDNCSVSSFTSTHLSGSIFPQGSTTVVYTAVDGSGNNSTCSFVVEVNIAPSVLTLSSQVGGTGCLGDTVTLSVTNPDLSTTYSWVLNGNTVGTGSSYGISSTKTSDLGTYTVTATTTIGCTVSNTISLNLLPCDIIIPEIFSPNGDNVNETFYIKNLESFPNTSVWIHNRWGAEVFHSTDYKNNWNGISQSKANVGGDKLPEGTYYYILQLGGVEGSATYGNIYKGFVYLKR